MAENEALRAELTARREAQQIIDDARYTAEILKLLDKRLMEKYYSVDEHIGQKDPQ